MFAIENENSEVPSFRHSQLQMLRAQQMRAGVGLSPNLDPQGFIRSQDEADFERDCEDEYD